MSRLMAPKELSSCLTAERPIPVLVPRKNSVCVIKTVTKITKMGKWNRMMCSIKVIQAKIVIESTKTASETNEFSRSGMMAGKFVFGNWYRRSIFKGWIFNLSVLFKWSWNIPIKMEVHITLAILRKEVFSFICAVMHEGRNINTWCDSTEMWFLSHEHILSF